MKTVAQILKFKGSQVYSVSPDQTVLEALELLVEMNIGGLVVLEGTRLVGIFTERDYARKVVLKGKTSKDTAIREIMTEKVLTVTPSQTVDQCMAIMTGGHFRHLPVVENEHILGVISIGDLVKAVMAEQKHQIEQLENYISGR